MLPPNIILLQYNSKTKHLFAKCTVEILVVQTTVCPESPKTLGKQAVTQLCVIVQTNSWAYSIRRAILHEIIYLNIISTQSMGPIIRVLHSIAKTWARKLVLQSSTLLIYLTS
jgi:hypothetical protein